MIQLATCVSQTHLEHLNLFLTTIGEFGSIDVTWMPQISSTSHTWEGKGWGEQLRLKAHAMQDAALRNKKEFMLWSDVDVVFLKPCIDRMVELMNEGDYDMLAQYAGKGVCAGFYVARMTPKFHHLLDVIVKDGKAYKTPAGDQHSMNQNLGLVTWGVLPPAEFWTPGWRGPNRGFKEYGSVDHVQTPDTAYAMHACFCKGPALKLASMQRSLEQVKS